MPTCHTFSTSCEQALPQPQTQGDLHKACLTLQLWSAHIVRFHGRLSRSHFATLNKLASASRAGQEKGPESAATAAAPSHARHAPQGPQPPGNCCSHTGCGSNPPAATGPCKDYCVCPARSLCGNQGWSLQASAIRFHD